MQTVSATPTEAIVVKPQNELAKRAVLKGRIHGTIDLFPEKNGMISPGAVIEVMCTTFFEVPEGMVGLMSIRRSTAHEDLVIRSGVIHGGFKGRPVIHISNENRDHAYHLSTNEAIVQIVFVKTVTAFVIGEL